MRLGRFPLALTSVLLACVLSISSAAEQAATPLAATIDGTLKDRVGEAIPDITIEIRDTADAVVATAKTDAEGRFRLTASLPPATYRVVALRDGLMIAQEPFVLPTLTQGTNLTIELVARSTTRARPAPKPGDPPYTIVKLFYATDRKPTGSKTPGGFYTTDRRDGGAVELGTCEVSIPKDHRLAMLEAPSIWSLEFFEDPSRHVVLLSVRPEDPAGFYGQLRTRVDQSKGKEAFVFVHGFNVPFENAARRTAQLAYDLEFDGAPIMFSWPGGERLWHYTTAEANADWSVPHLLAFLKELSTRSGATRIHLIAHSMGNRVMANALNLLSLSEPAKLPMFQQVVLTAPDIDADVFRQLAAQITKTAAHITLYASSTDQALIASNKLHAYPRAGQAGQGLVVLPGIDTIDVSAVDSSLDGHSYYGDSTSVLSDLVWLIRQGYAPNLRAGLRIVEEGRKLFWKLLPAKTP